MLAFFFSLFRHLVRGGWQLYPLSHVLGKTDLLLNRVGTLLVNALGGNFETLQTFTLCDENLMTDEVFACIASIIAVALVTTITFRIVKQVFAIFFGGR